MDLTIRDGRLGALQPTVTKPHPDFLSQVGEERLRALVNDHYELIRHTKIAFMFPVDYEEDFSKVKKHAADFLIQLCGGPDYYAQTRGDSRILARHTRFRIDENGRRIWLECYAELLPELEREGVDPKLIQSFWDYLNTFSILMVNTPRVQGSGFE
ncbi:MAG: globin [Sulfuricurvum sp.]|uniref:globin domain-containing protein n=1 Tax=Sulfuricurvum sp. TaxID=2025608 RepID=UPI0025DA50F4|nr:globin [Sulfuricurvum sp.]MCK9374357.1 globin [Sulfuricurvum sp.]